MDIRKGAVTFFAGVQWLVFMFANTVVIPLSIGSAFHQSAIVIAGAMSRSFILTGAACLIQAFVGHRLPLMEGQSGLWWGVILGLAATGSASGLGLAVIGGSLAIGMMCGGLALVICGLFGLHRILNRLFTPIVMAVLLFLLGSQLIDIFFKGMVGLENGKTIDLRVAVLSFVLVAGVSALTIGGRGLLSNFAVLIGLVVGWIAYVSLIGSGPAVVVPDWSDITGVFVWGSPSFHAGIIVVCIITALINTTNTIATLRAAEPVFHQQMDDIRYRRSLILSGIYTFVSGPLALVAYAPYTSSIGFLRTTRLFARAPFLVGAALFGLIGFVPPLVGFFASLPISVGATVLFVAYLQLFGSALQNLHGISFNYKTIFRIAAPTLIGLAIQSTPSTAFSSLPGMIQSLVSNGMLVGILVAVILEAVVPWHRLENAVTGTTASQ